MAVTAPERRKIVVLSGDQRTDAAVPFDDTLGDALRGLGYSLQTGRHVVLERSGSEASLDALGADLHDGSLFAIVDLHQVEVRPRKSRAIVDGATDHGALWWMLATAAVLVAAIALVDVGSASSGLRATERILASVVLGVGAVVSSVVWAMRRPKDVTTESIAMLAPLALAFSAGCVAVPPQLEASFHLAIVTGLLAAGVLASLLTATVSGTRIRSATSTASIILISLAAVWGLTLMMGWDAAAAAALSAGAVPPALRFLPTTLVNVPDGYHIDYRHFMSSRWTVRGAIPESPDTVAIDDLRSVVAASSARLVTGTVLLSAVAVAFVPFALPRMLDDNPFIAGGAIAMICALVIGLLLAPRHSGSPVLRWVPRAASGIILLVMTMAVVRELGAVLPIVIAATLLTVGIVAAATVVPIARGARSLGWSRLADVFESLAVAFSFPAGLLAADILTALRGMMAS